MVNTKIRLIIFFAAEDGEALYSQEKQDQDLTVAQMVLNLPAMQDTWVPSLGQEDVLEKRTATQSSILTWRIPRTDESGGLQSMGSQRVRHD